LLERSSSLQFVEFRLWRCGLHAELLESGTLEIGEWRGIPLAFRKGATGAVPFHSNIIGDFKGLHSVIFKENVRDVAAGRWRHM